MCDVDLEIELDMLSKLCYSSSLVKRECTFQAGSPNELIKHQLHCVLADDQFRLAEMSSKESKKESIMCVELEPYAQISVFQKDASKTISNDGSFLLSWNKQRLVVYTVESEHTFGRTFKIELECPDK